MLEIDLNADDNKLRQILEKSRVVAIVGESNDVDEFRSPEHLDQIVTEALAVGAKVLWAQLDVVSIDQRPEQRAAQGGLQVISNHCIRTEHERLKIPAKRR